MSAEADPHTLDGVSANHQTLLAELESGASAHSAILRAYGWDLDVYVAEMAVAQIDQIVIRRLNDFAADNAVPRILDCGANIGISVLNYKRQFPQARIVAFEPDTTIYRVLHRNLITNGAADVEAIDAAVWTRTGHASFLSNGGDGGRIRASVRGTSKREAAEAQVRTIDLREYLDTSVDLLKLDIEGAEYAVMRHIAKHLAGVKNVIVECHIDQTTIGAFGELLDHLRRAGFHVMFNTFGRWRDLIRQPEVRPLHWAQYVAVYAWRAAPPPSTSSCVPYLELSLLREYHRARDAHGGPREYQRSKAAAVNPTLLSKAERLQGPYTPVGGLAWTVRLPETLPEGDTPEAPAVSRLVLLEDDRPLGPPHCEHVAIQRYGGGRFSHWRDHLYFSTTDDSDPNANGRAYAVVMDDSE